MTTGGEFDYDHIPPGYYDRVMTEGPAIQRAWHRQKFSRVRELLALPPGGRLLDVGCGPGSFLGGFELDREGAAAELVGIDIAAEQVEYANQRYGHAQRRFLSLGPDDEWPFPAAHFDAITIIEVVEHLHPEQIRSIADRCGRVLKPGGSVVITTPNYASHWPVLEWLIARASAVSYHEQHITRFNRFTVRRRLAAIMGDRFRVVQATTMHFVAPFLAPLSSRVSDSTASALTPRQWWWPFGALIIAKIRFEG